METIGGDGSKTGLVMKKKGKQINDRYQCQPHPDYWGKESNNMQNQHLVKSK